MIQLVKGKQLRKLKAEKEISLKGNIPLCMVLMSEPLMMLLLIMMLPDGVNCSKHFFKNSELKTETRKEILKICTTSCNHKNQKKLSRIQTKKTITLRVLKC